MLRKYLDGAVVADPTLNSRQIRVIANSGQPDRVGDVLVAAGCDLSNYRRNPIVLSNHDPSEPIGTARVFVAGDHLEAVVTFAPSGASEEADKVCALTKGGVLGAVSVGFRPIASKPRRDRGEEFTTWELLELSVVSVPCDPGAVVIGRSYGRRSGRVLNGQNLTALANVMRELDKCATVHADAVDMLDKADRHRERASSHAARIAASAAPQDGYDDPDDDGGDVELAYNAAARRRRQIEAYRPERNLDPAAERRRRQVQIAEFSAL